MKKRISSLLVAFVMVLVMLPVSTAEEYDDYPNREASWNQTELTGYLSIEIEDVERIEDTYRIANTNDPFQDASMFKLPITVTIKNTSVPYSSHSGGDIGPVLTVGPIELKVPNRFVLEWSYNDHFHEVSLDPGEYEEFDGYLMVDNSSIHRQVKELEYTVSAYAKSNFEGLKDERNFTVSLVTAQDNAPSNGEYSWLPTERLETITDPESAAAAIEEMTGRMTDEQKSDPECIDLATLFAENAAAKAATKVVDSGEIEISLTSLDDFPLLSSRAVSAVDSALSSGGIAASRQLFTTVVFRAEETDKINAQVDSSILSAKVDKIRVEAPTYALTLKTADLKDDLTEPLTFKAQEVTSSYALKNNNDKVTIQIDLPKAQMINPVTISLPQSNEDITYKAIVKSDGSASASKYNPVTGTMDGRVNTSGTYTVKTNEKSFTDISSKSAEMQKAILYLASKGIIGGTSATKFSPDNSINRQQITALIMRALGKVDNTATTTFTDVPVSSSLYHAIASSQRHKIINGYSDNTFRGTNVISKNQIVTVSGRVLTSEMKYKAPANMSTYLGKYKDSVPEYAQEMVALATREGMVVYRTDGTFSGDKNMTRGDAAIILYRLFQKIW